MRIAAIALLLLALPQFAHAQSPALIAGKPVRIVVPSAGGGNPDVLARMLAPRLQATWGTPIVVDNQPGAGGISAAISISKSAPDGHLLFFGSNAALSIAAAMNPKLPYDPLKDFTLITALASVPTVLVVNPSVPANNLQEFIAYAKTRPGQLNFGSAGVASIHHLTLAVFEVESGTKFLHIPYKGGSPLVAAVMAGEVQAGFSGIPNVVQAIRAGKMKVFGLSVPDRSKSMPDVPTIDELGVKGFNVATTIGLQTSVGLHRNLVTLFQQSFAKYLRDAEIADRMANLGMVLMENGTDNYLQFMKDEAVRYAAAVKAAGIKFE
ncbi:MAG: Bug family tripartite tricarboxylate transporter substrate binding protein [Burkholderiales bacterium]